jgi:hypothetical protein
MVTGKSILALFLACALCMAASADSLAGEAPDPCPNAALRGGLSTDLPDCRAYEMVSPVEKNGSQVLASQYKQFLASTSGDRITFSATTNIGENSRGSGVGGISQYLASRGEQGWSITPLTPTPAISTPLQFSEAETRLEGFSEELDRSVLRAYDLPNVAGGIPHSENLYVENLLAPAIESSVSSPEDPQAVSPVIAPFELALRGVSADGEDIVFATPRNLVALASGSERKLYVWRHGSIELAGVLPDGSSPTGGSDGPRVGVSPAAYEDSYKDTVSRDGSRAFFVAPAEGAGQQLYVREDGTRTVWVSQSETSTPIAQPTGVRFQAATPDARKVVFVSHDPLLDGDPGGAGEGVYLFTDGPDPEHESNLTFLGRNTVPAASNVHIVKGISADGSHVYVALNGSLMLWDEGRVVQVASAPERPDDEVRISPHGQRVAFMSGVPTAGYELPVGGLGLDFAAPNTEIYVYDETSETVRCVSCPPEGGLPTTGVHLRASTTDPTNPAWELTVRPRFFSEDGRYVFFNTEEALLPQDTNGVSDAYEYDVETGKLALLSPGSGAEGTWFVEASPNGHDVFLATRQHLTGWDPDLASDLYDARIGGGLPEPLPPPPPCAGDACQGVPSAAPTFDTASGFAGLGNLPVPHAGKAASRSALRADRLKRALRACERTPKRKRAACKARARKRYGKSSSAKRAVRQRGR